MRKADTSQEICFTVFGPPKGKGRPRFSRGRNNIYAYTPPTTKKYEQDIREAYRMQIGAGILLQGPISAEIVCYYPIPKSESKSTKESMKAGDLYPLKKPDLDNVLKCVLDACNDLVYLDDKQICCVRIEKRYGIEPRVEIRFCKML